MNRDEIKDALRAKSLTYSIISEASGFSPSAISQVISRSNKSKPIANVIAKSIDIPIEDVFPELFERQLKRQQTIESLRQTLAS